MEDETELLKSALCMKEHENFALRAELDRRNVDAASLAMALERLEKTFAAYCDRIGRKLDRLEGKRRHR